MDKHPKGFFVRHFGLRGVAVFEAGKGLFALGFGFWLLSLLHKDMHQVAGRLLEFLHKTLHISPDRHLYQQLLRALGGLTPSGLRIIIFLVVVYAAIRFVEATGLWLEKAWAEWFALISGSLYLPLEIYELVRHPTGIKWGILGINILVVVYLAWLLMDSYRRKREARAGTESQGAG
jgi:uncharacterized membrane protein (DUF2068 family)